MIQANSLIAKRLKLVNGNPNILCVEKVRTAYLIEAISVVLGIMAYYLLNSSIFNKSQSIDIRYQIFFVAAGVIMLYFGLKKIEKNLKVFRSGEIIQFDRIKDLVLINEVGYDRLSNISSVENCIRSDSDGAEYGKLKVLFSSKKVLELDSNLDVTEAEWIGTNIAKFAECKFEIRKNGINEAELLEEARKRHEFLVGNFEVRFKNKTVQELNQIIEGQQ